MEINEKGLNLIKSFEGLKLEAYLCPAGVWTIGYGHTKGVKKGMKITKEKADELLMEDLQEFQNGVEKLISPIKLKDNQFSKVVSFVFNLGSKNLKNSTLPIKLTDNQFSALVSFTFNLGLTNLKNSTLLKKVNQNPNDETIRNEFMRWIYAGGKPLEGLKRRRKHEADLYFTKE